MSPPHVVCAALLWSGAVLAAPADRPCVTLSRTSRAPTIDGRIEPEEWAEAAALGGLLSLEETSVAQPGSLVYLTFDDRAVYLAARCEEPDPTRPRGFVRAHDDRAFEDDAVQLYLAPEDLRQAKTTSIAFGGYEGAYDTWYDDLAAHYEFTVNCRGSITEARNDVRDWDAPWSAKVSREAGGWSAEMAVPFASLGVTAPPEGALWGLNVFRVRPPDLSGWVCPAFGGYRPLPLGAVLLSTEQPVARQAPLRPAQLGANELAFDVRNAGPRTAEVELAVTPPSGPPTVRTLSLPPRESGQVSAPYTLAGEGALRARYAVRVIGEQAPLLSGFVPLTVPAKVEADLRYYALPGRVEGTVHLGPTPLDAQATLTLQPAAGAGQTQQVALAERRGAILALPVTGRVGDAFRARLEVRSADGALLAERTRDLAIPGRPAWLGTRAGLPLGVLPPWTPIRARDKTVEMLGKRFTFRDLALPASIAAAGAELLSAPIRLAVESGGKPVAWEARSCRFLEQTPEHVRIESLWRSPSLELRVTSDLEYDGFAWNEITLTPRGRVSVGRVALEVPLRREVCGYVYQGHAQAAHALSPLGLRRPLSANLWVGDEARGLAFLAESLEWAQARDRARQVEIAPEGGGRLWRSTFIDTPTDLGQAYVARFALHVTPAKPVSLRKSRIFHGAYYGLESAPSGGALTIPVRGRLDLDQGTFECRVRPKFDTGESYDQPDRSAYNRQFLLLFSDAGEALILYYNADDRSFRAVTKNAQGAYPVILSGRARLPSKQWSYVALSWGEKLRLSVNGEVSEAEVRGTVRGQAGSDPLHLDLSCFDLDEVRLSSAPRPIETVPTGEFAADAQTLFLDHCERPEGPDLRAVPGRFGKAYGAGAETAMDRLAREGKRIVIFHENWSRYQGYPDLEQTAKLKKLADACHARGMIFLVYFCQMMSDAAPEWPGLKDDFMVPPGLMWYHRDDVKQDCWVSCVNGPYGELLLDGIARLADEAGIDGVYMDGTTVPWECANPAHPGCGEARSDGAYLGHQPLRATRTFMKRLRSLFAQRRKVFFLDAHTGGAINVATQSFCDGYYDGEHLARYRPGFRLSPDAFLTGYMAGQFGFRADFLPNRYTMDQALAISLIHDTATRGQPAAVDLAWAAYEDAETRYVPYWERSPLYSVSPREVPGSLYLKRDRALLVLGSQTEAGVTCEVEVGRLLRLLPAGVQARDAVSGESLPLASGRLRFPLPGRGWRMVELRGP